MIKWYMMSVLGDVFIFINRQRTTMKLLHAEDGGLVLCT
ncbi:IS66 family insertion sequence element accessory protein TnpB [Bacteroides thetaiotaomicron]|nr:IS66 family insertion sequence element accessory protein TnpB [Bacteroides thetaiotaomicron]